MAHDPRVRSPEYRHQRAEQLRTLLAKVHETTTAFDFRSEIAAFYKMGITPPPPSERPTPMNHHL